MNYGHFDDARREYVITRPDTPYPWINYLGGEAFFSLISNTSGGYAFYRDARLLRLTRYRYNNVPTDVGGRYFYLRDGETVWNPGWQPTRTALDRYECRHGLGYTVISSAKNGIAAKQCTMVPRGLRAEATRLTLTNESLETRTVSVYSFVEFCLWNALDDSTNFQRNYALAEVEVEDGGATLYHKSEYRERRNHYAVFAVNAPVDGYDTDRETFMGLYNGFDRPDAVLADKPGNSQAHGWAPVGSHCLRRTLAPGESVSFLFVLGYCESPADRKFIAPGVINKEDAHALLSQLRTDEQFEAKLAELRTYWAALLDRFTIQTPDEKLDRQVNIWNQYQCMVTFNLSRSASYFESGIGRGMGFRDCSQDLLGFVHLIPELARARILDIAATQFPDGSAYHQYQPLTKRGNLDVGSGFNDDPLWLLYAVIAYVKETGDLAIVEEAVDFDNQPSLAAPMREHLRRAFHYTADHCGPHGLPLIGRADWNDCLNLNCYSAEPGESFQTVTNHDTGIAESVFIAGMFVGVAEEYARLCELAGNAQEAAFARRRGAEMTAAIERHGWDGAWFLRAYDANGDRVGSATCEEGRIFIEPQGMCVMAGVGRDNGMAQRALDSTREHLLFDYGVVLNWPAYRSYRLNLGEISSYPPGYKENGSVFCHNNPWIVIAETVLGHGDRAFDVYRRTAPAYIEDQRLHRTEPYVYSQTVNGMESFRPGEAKNSWLTGTAAWNFYAVSQAVLGIKPQLDGLMIDPCLPSHLTEVRVSRVFRGNRYEITMQNLAGGEKGTVALKVDGQPINGQTIPAPAEAGGVIRVEVSIR
ncbi:MAG: glycosyl transferase [Clostridiales bacterium]|nr:glycosyl transferase [Clostridiales bacterium]